MGGQTGHLLVGPTGAKGRPLNVTRATNYYTIPVTQGATDLLRLHPPPLLLNVDFRLLLRDRSLEHWLPPHSFFPSCPNRDLDPSIAEISRPSWNYLKLFASSIRIIREYRSEDHFIFQGLGKIRAKERNSLRSVARFRCLVFSDEHSISNID